MKTPFPFDQVGRLPAPGDNVAIAVRRLEVGTQIECGQKVVTLPHTILEGHRFAIQPIAIGQPLLSWGLPFGLAVRELRPGDYVCNERILPVLRQRHVDFVLPDFPNFQEHHVRYQWDESTFRPTAQVPRHSADRVFQGYARGGARGVGTRNFVAIVGASSLAGSYARTLAERFRDVPAHYSNIDGVTAIAHTEGGGSSRPNNLEFVLRTLAGFLVHPNLGAVLAVDVGTEAITNAMLLSYMQEHGYPLEQIAHRFLSVRGRFQAALWEGETIVRSWLDQVNAAQRTPQSLEHIKLGLQCGGSDAFSGVSGNPLAGWVAKKVIRYGGSANLAETDELIGAQSYVLSKVRDAETGRAFLRQIDRFEERVAWHGHTAEENPSGGNMFRGLYNIALKSIGAARKKDPEVRLDYVIDYGERMQQPGFYFMDSPGNDLESVAGQVAAGCNLILFTTGNGSITNFPFVPTIKIMTNTGRFNLLSKEMDVNAGRYLAGTPMDELGGETFEYTLKVATGQRSVGEGAGHSQVQIWREWRQKDGSRLGQIQKAASPNGEPLRVKQILAERSDREPQPSNARFRYKAFHTQHGYASDQIGLIIPTSLCSGQIARMIAEKLNQAAPASGPRPNGITRYVALAHTEGCGVSSGDSEQLYLRTMAAYLCHPSVRRALLLEHGCEKTHNDAMQAFLEEQQIDPSRFGRASVQLDGGLEKVTARVMNWFRASSSEDDPAPVQEAGLEALRLGLSAASAVPEKVAKACAQLAGIIVQAGGSVVVPQNSALLAKQNFVTVLLQSPEPWRPTLAYGQPFTKAGLHVMETPTDHQVETLTGLGATGVEVILIHVAGQPLQGHPMIPMLQVSSDTGKGNSEPNGEEDLDLFLRLEDHNPAALAEQMLNLVTQVAGRAYAPKLFAQGNTDFQMTRGWLGVSM